MKKLSLLVVLFVGMAFTKQAISQNLTGQNAALFDYDCIFTDGFIEKARQTEEHIRPLSSFGDDKLKGCLVHNTFYAIKAKLEEDKQFAILPPNSFQDKVNYDDYGYPKATIQRAIKKSDSKYFIKLYVLYDIIELEGVENKDKIKPLISFEVNIYSQDGYIPIITGKSEVKSEGIMILDKNFLAGMAPGIDLTSEIDNCLLQLLHQAIENTYSSL